MLRLIYMFACVVLLLVLTVSAPWAQDKFLAVFINEQTLGFADATGDSREEALRLAAEACGAGCKQAGWSKNACLAVAVRQGEGSCWGCDWGDTIEEAEQKALRRCKGHGCECAVTWSRCYK